MALALENRHVSIGAGSSSSLIGVQSRPLRCRCSARRRPELRSQWRCARHWHGIGGGSPLRGELVATVEHVGASAALTRVPVAAAFDAEAGQFVSPRVLAWRNRVAFPDQERTMAGIRRYCVERREFPPGKNRLHHLVAERDPIDTAKQVGFIHLRRWRSTEPKHDLRVDARLSTTTDPIGHSLL